MATICLLVGDLLTDGLSIALELAYYRVLDRFDQGAFMQRAEDLDDAEILENLMTFLGVVQIILQLATVVVFLIWLYRSHANLKAFGATGLSCSPGWAVGCFFVPILNLFRPYQVMQEIWKASNPDRSTSAREWQRARGSALILFWWFGWLASNIATQVAVSTNLGTPPTIAGAKFGAIASVVAAILGIVASVFLIFVVHGITDRQAQKFEREYTDYEGASAQ